MDNIAVEVNNISMRFNLSREKIDSLKEYFIKVVTRKMIFDEFYALKNISFKVNKGESYAIMGKNGSGKSTMLKIISQIYKPTEGTIIVNGLIAPMIELGAGFDQQLTAKENIYLNGSILGYDRKFMNEKHDEILDFSELWDFEYVPVKNFSSGMRARLGFAIATVVKPDILIVDEVLGVGDFEFRKKCENRIQQLLSGGTTLLLVSHSQEQVKKLCERAIWLEKGISIMEGDVDTVCKAYHES